MSVVAAGMGSLLESLAVAAVVLAGGLVGLALQRLLPSEHITNQKTHEVILLGTGMLSVLASLVLGLQITTAKSSYDATDAAVRNYAAELILLDEILRDYGPKAAIARDCLRAFATRMKDDIWHDPDGTAPPVYCPDAASPTAGAKATGLDMEATGRLLERVREEIRALKPYAQTDRDEQRALAELQDEALKVDINLLRQRWILIEQGEPTVQTMVFWILVLWIVAIFVSFGLSAPPNATVISAFLTCALAIGGAVFLILEMNRPLQGVMRISRDPLVSALCHMAWKPDRDPDPHCDRQFSKP